MRKWLVIPAWASIGLLVYACDDDDNKAAADAGADVAPTSTQTSMPQVDGSIPDNYVPPADTGPVPGVVTVIVTDSTGALVSGIDVYFTEPDGTVVKVTTDATGKALHTELGGGSITVAEQVLQAMLPSLPIQEIDVTTVLAVQPGDVIHAGVPIAGAFTNGGQVTGSIQAAPANVDAGLGAISYSLDFGAGCDAEGSVNEGLPPVSYNYVFEKECIDATGKIAFVAVARDTNNNILAYAPKVATVGADAGVTAVDVATGDWQVASTKTVATTGNFPANFTSAQLTVGSPHGAFSYVTSNVNADMTPVPTLTYNVLPTTFAPSVQLDTSFYNFSNGETHYLAHTQRVSDATALAEDFGKFLPRIFGVAATGTTNAPIITWQEDAALTTGSIGNASVTGRHTPEAGQGYNVNWQIVFPAAGNTTTITFPTLPQAIADALTPDQPWQVGQVELAVSPVVPYTLARQYPIVVQSPTTFASQIPAGVAFDLKTTNVQPGGG